MKKSPSRPHVPPSNVPRADGARPPSRPRQGRRAGPRFRDLGSRLRARVLSSADTISVVPLPTPDAPPQRGRRADPPLLLVTRADGTRACLVALRRCALERDPSLGGRRRELEDACRLREADLEIWTETEIDRDSNVAQVARPATAAERAGWARAAPLGRGEGAAYAEAFALRLGIDDLRPVGNGLVGIQRLTGIATALLCDLEVDLETRMIVWRPRSCSVGS